MDFQIITQFSTIAHAIAEQWERDEIVNTSLIVQYPFHLPLNELVAAIDEWANSINEDQEAYMDLPVKLEDKINEWVKVGRVISEEWQDDWNENYPFHKDFMEILCDMAHWGGEVVV